MRPKILGSVVTIMCLCSSLAQAQEPENGAANSLAEAIINGKATINFRYRLENVQQDGFAKDATASTLRTKLKYTTGTYKDFSALIEFDNVSEIGSEDYNSTVNGKVDFPVVVDPTITELNQFQLIYTGLEKTKLFVGRTALNLNNQRFFGTVGWRQNDQTWDMVGGTTSPTKALKLTYGYVWNVNRIFGDDSPKGDLDTNTYILNAEYTGFSLGKLTAYGFAMDFKDAPAFGLSNRTFGLRFEGKKAVGSGGAKVLYDAEIATQSDYEDNPNSYTSEYYRLGAGVADRGAVVKLNYEVLGSDNGVGFQTPLATLHKFNGWADVFLNTPATGLEDIYASASYKFGAQSPLAGWKFDAIYHDFSANTGGADYGTETDLQVTRAFREHYYAGLKFADYRADSFSTDTQKVWFTLGANF